MKNLVKVARLAIVGYCAYKLIDTAVENKKKAKESEEYVPFDELPVVIDEPKNDDLKKVIVAAGGAVLVSTVLKQKHQIDKLAKQVDENHDLIMKLGYVVDTNVDKAKECIQDICVLTNEACKIAAVNFAELDIRVDRLERK